MASPSFNPKANKTVGGTFPAIFLMLLISTLLLGGMGTRLFYLQLVEGQRNRELAEDNRIRLMPRRPERGQILDRNGEILAGSRLSYSVYLWPIDFDEADRPVVVQRLSEILGIPATEIQARIDQGADDATSLIPISRGISPTEATAIAELSSELPGIGIEAEAVRNYPHGDLAAHILGYTGELTADDLAELKPQGYRLGDVVGQMGVEDAFEAQLRGTWGGRQVEVDSAGEVIQVLGEEPSESGSDIQLTLDLNLQKAAERILGNRTGAIVAINPQNGEVLAMVSRPTFDPNLFSTYITDEQWQQLQRKEFPFVNRALQGYAPASTFKIVTSTAAIESGAFSHTDVLPTYPYITAGGIQFWDWNNAGFGPLGFPGAMAWSSDTFFYQTAMRMGEQPLIQWTRRFGFGQKTGIEIGREEAPGLVPDAAWKEENLNEGWYLGDTINMSIGQGYLQTSPLQVAVMFAVAANGGDRVIPHLLKGDGSATPWRESLNISPETIRTLQDGLRRVITMGTGRAVGSPNLPAIAGKSGTAEAPPRENHTWFGAYGPIDDPEIVVVAFGEHSGGGGGSVAGPMVRQLLEVYFNKANAETVTQTQPDAASAGLD